MDAENGNSFIPRLWARMHLDVLLEQGRTAAVKDEIISLSEEYKIMTPYTSFLVLESDGLCRNGGAGMGRGSRRFSRGWGPQEQFGLWLECGREGPNIEEHGIFNGLDAHQDAIGALTSAYGRKLLDEGGISQLAAYLEHLQRDAEAVPYLAEIVTMNPGNPDYRRRLVGSLGRSGQRDEALAAVAGAVDWFKGKHSWNEANLAPLAQGCHEGGLWERGVGLFDELIALHQRTQPNRGIGNGTLSGSYTRLSECHAGTGDTAKAVEAAAGSIVSWGPRHDQRAQALHTLHKVLEQAEDIDGYAAQLDQEASETGLENPVVRKALGEVFCARKDYPKAILHLRRAVEAQPDDMDTHKLLVAAYDGLQDAEQAVRQLLDGVALSPRSIELLKDLGTRFGNIQAEAAAILKQAEAATVPH